MKSDMKYTQRIDLYGKENIIGSIHNEITPMSSGRL